MTSWAASKGKAQRIPSRVLASRLDVRASLLRAKTYPLTEFAHDPVRYARERLGIRNLLPHQEEILRAICDAVHGRARPRVAVRSGQKDGKTKIVIVAALWFYESFSEARVYCCAAIEEQTKGVLWNELGITLRAAERHGSKIDGILSRSPKGGFTSTDDSRQIKGLGGREIESVAGLSGNQLMIVDEASHLPKKKYEVFEGNNMGGGVVVFISNPTRTDGPFYDAFHGARAYWQTFHLDSEVIVAWLEAHNLEIPGIVTRARVEEKREMYGTDSPFWIVRVKGDFLKHETGRAIPMWKIDEAIARWALMGDTLGPLTIGYDPAGPGVFGDEHAWAIRRGPKILHLHTRRGLNDDEAVAETLSVLRMWRRPTDPPPRIVLDAEGPIGSVIFARLRSESERLRLGRSAEVFDVHAVRASSRFVRDKTKFDRVRDELIWNFAEWLSEGAVPNDPFLQGELYEPVWQGISGGRIRATAKSDIKEKLGRSPDRFDACALSVWTQRLDEPTDSPAEDPAGELGPGYEGSRNEQTGDPFAGGYSSAEDPYGGGYGRRLVAVVRGALARARATVLRAPASGEAPREVPQGRRGPRAAA